ncbi:MAG: hypothetical protein NUV74_05390 [Candidatus Brocadiaceae bacterium]|nr:hypothetical protein [Candidatus Brocadiaceae bacterium]
MKASEWNEWYEIGYPVLVKKDDGSVVQTKTRSEAWELGHGQAVIKLEGISGGYSLDRVQAMETHK